MYTAEVNRCRSNEDDGTAHMPEAIAYLAVLSNKEAPVGVVWEVVAWAAAHGAQRADVGSSCPGTGCLNRSHAKQTISHTSYIKKRRKKRLRPNYAAMISRG